MPCYRYKTCVSLCGRSLMLNRAGSYDDAFLSCTFKYVLSKRFFFCFFFLFSCYAGSFPHKEKTKKSVGQ